MFVYNFKDGKFTYEICEVISDSLVHNKYRNVVLKTETAGRILINDFPKEEWKIKNYMFYSYELDMDKVDEVIKQYYKHIISKHRSLADKAFIDWKRATYLSKRLKEQL